MRDVAIASLVLALGCGPSAVRSAADTGGSDGGGGGAARATGVAPTPLPSDGPDASAAAPSGPEPSVEPPVGPGASTAAAAHGTAAATIGLDLRALPTSATSSGIDMFVLGQGDRLRALAPPGAEVEIRHVPGTGGLIPVFRAPTEAEAEALCVRVVAEYLEHAPRLPVIMQPAAHLVEPCRVVEDPRDAPPPSD
jgi:hypothetical protein